MATIPAPLFFRSDTNLQIMTSTDITNVINQVIAVHSSLPGITLSVSGLGDSDDLGPITNTRLVAGAISTSTTAFPSEATTQEPQLVSTDYYIGLSKADSNQPVNPLPIYRNDDGSIQSMTPNDFVDTFIKPAIDTLLDSTNYGTTTSGGLYTISTLDSGSDLTLIGTAFVDTIYNNATTTYYLLRQNGTHDYTTDASHTGVYRRSDGNLQAYSLTEWNDLIYNWTRYTVANTPGYKIQYSVDSANGPGVILGSGMVDTRLTGGSGDYTQTFVNADNYRAQELPNGTPTVISTTYLKVARG